ncbi:MAG: hypothetical protein J0H99_20390, partial [Rhodospirillales bacterium]|nr:hypothetical protein [Rhodospirillales bacterium]
LVELVAIRTWAAAAGDWFDAGNWTTQGTVAPNDFPQPGDTAIISSGTPTITTADFAQHGSLDNGVILLSGTAAGIVLGTGTLGPDLTLESTAARSNGVVTVTGTVVSDASLSVTGAGASLVLDMAGDGTAAGQFVNGFSSQIFVGVESALQVTGGELTNLGVISLNGDMTVAAGATLDGSGAIEIEESNSTLTVAGTIGPQQQVQLYEDTVVVTATGTFLGTIESFGNGDTIDLQGVTASSLSFDNEADVLTLWNDGSAVARLAIAGDYGDEDFALSADGSGGVLITDPIQTMQTLFYTTLPSPALLSPGESTTLSSLLLQSFGTDYARTITQVQLSSPSLGDIGNFSYWDPNQPSLPYWTIDGTPVAPDATPTVSAAA